MPSMVRVPQIGQIMPSHEELSLQLNVPVFERRAVQLSDANPARLRTSTMNKIVSETMRNGPSVPCAE